MQSGINACVKLYSAVTRLVADSDKIVRKDKLRKDFIDPLDGNSHCQSSNKGQRSGQEKKIL